MDFIRRLNRENFYFSSQCFQIWWQISSTEVKKTHKISAQISLKLWLLGQKNTGTWVVNNTIAEFRLYFIYIVPQ